MRIWFPLTDTGLPVGRLDMVPRVFCSLLRWPDGSELLHPSKHVWKHYVAHVVRYTYRRAAKSPA